MTSEHLSQQETERFSRHLSLPGFEERSQLLLKSSAVLVVGVGGLGSPAALYLAAAGVGTIGIAEFDRIERHNLQRQVLFDDASVGKPKAEVAKLRLQALHPALTVRLHPEGVTRDNVMKLLAGYDLVIDGSDNFGTRYLLNDATYFAGKALVSGSVFQSEGQVMVLNAGADAPCYRCLFPEPPSPGSVPDCNQAGVIGALCGVVGSLQAMEAIKLITGYGAPLSGTLLKLDLAGNRFTPIQLPKDPMCSLCSGAARIVDLNSEPYSLPCEVLSMKQPSETTLRNLPVEIDVEQAKTLLDQGEALFLDIREPDEAEICQIAPSRFLPMGEVPHQLASLPRDRPLVVYCHHGYRSLRVVQYLRNQGIEQCCSMRGGIDRWALRWDPAMDRY